MNFLEAAAEIFQHHPIASIGGAVVAAAVLWKAAKAGWGALKAHVENERKLEALKANRPKPLRLSDFLNERRP